MYEVKVVELVYGLFSNNFVFNHLYMLIMMLTQPPARGLDRSKFECVDSGYRPTVTISFANRTLCLSSGRWTSFDLTCSITVTFAARSRGGCSFSNSHSSLPVMVYCLK